MNKNNKNFNKPLGRGLSSLLGEKTDINFLKSEESLDKINKISIDLISSGPWQARKNFDKNELKSLSKSIKDNGIIQPILVCADKKNIGKYLIIAGERRWRAAQIAQVHEIPVIIKDDLTDKKLSEISLLENLQRSDLNPIEEAIGYKNLIEDFNYTQEKVSAIAGKSRPYITNIIRLLMLPEQVQKHLIDANLTIGHARALIGRKDAVQLSKQILKKNLTVRDVEKIINNNNRKPIYNNAHEDLERELSEKAGLKIKVNFNKNTKKGSIALICNGLDQFDYIIKKIKSF